MWVSNRTQFYIHNNTLTHLIAVIGGVVHVLPCTTSGEESLRRGKRCGSVVTRIVGGRSVYGLVKKKCSCTFTWPHEL